ncbi:MAG: aminotransferase, partial [Albimonas sp.]
APVPEPFRALGSLAISNIQLQEAPVALPPGIVFGQYGEGYVRLGLVENEQRIRQAARGVKKLLADPQAALERHHASLPQAAE